MPDQENGGPGVDPSCLMLCIIPGRTFSKKVILQNKLQTTQKWKNNPSMQRVYAEVHGPIYPLIYYNDLSTRQDKYVQTK